MRTFEDFEEDALQLSVGKIPVQPNHRSDRHPKKDVEKLPLEDDSPFVPSTLQKDLGEDSQEHSFGSTFDIFSDTSSGSLSVISKGLPLPSEGAVSKGGQPDEASQESCLSRAWDSSSDSGSDSSSVISKGLPLPSEGAVPGTGICVEAHASNAAPSPRRLPAAPTAIAGCSRESDIEMAEGYGIGRDLQDAVVSL